MVAASFPVELLTSLIQCCQRFQTFPNFGQHSEQTLAELETPGQLEGPCDRESAVVGHERADWALVVVELVGQVEGGLDRQLGGVVD